MDEKIYEIKDFNGVDGGQLTINKQDGGYLLMIAAEKGEGLESVWLTKQDFEEMLEKVEDSER